MTEMIVDTDMVWPTERHRDLNIRRFVLATFATPVLFAISGLLILGGGVLFTIVAAILSLPAYVLLGLPAFRYVIRHHRNRFGQVDRTAMALAGFAVNAGSLPLAYAYQLADGQSAGEAANLALWYAGLGMLAAPVMALIFAEVYRGPQKRTAGPDANTPPHTPLEGFA